MEIDPVCGMSVDPSAAAGAWPHRGSTYYFCSVGCLERFKADAEGVLATRAEDRSMEDRSLDQDPRG
jgi:P-type Cu+ transporter